MAEENPAGPFDTIESAEAFIQLLNESIEEALRDVEVDLTIATDERQQRRVEALNIVIYNLNRLTFHVGKSRRLLNDLRMLRRLLLEEREAVQKAKMTALGL